MKIKYNEGSKVDKVNLAELERQAQLDENSFENNPSINADINNKNIKTLLQDAENRIEKEQERKDANTDRQMREAAEKHFRRDLNEGGSMLMPPERERYVLGAAVKLGSKALKTAKKHVDDLKTKPTEGQDKIRDVTLAQRAARETQRKTGLGTATLIGGGVAADKLLSNDSDTSIETEEPEVPVYSIEDLPTEGAIIIESDKGEVTYKNTKLNKELKKAIKNKEEEVTYEDETFNTEALKTALNDFSKSNKESKSMGGKMKYAEGSMLMPPEREEYFDGGRAFKKLFKGAASVAEPAAKAAKSGVKGLGNIIQDTATVAKKGAKGLGHVIQDTATVAKRGAKGLGKMGGNLGFTQDQPDIAFAEGGSMLMPPEMEIEEQEEEQEMPVDTYPNIPPDEMAAAEASQLPDEQMEDEHLEYVLDEALDPEDQEYLMGVLETDERLSNIFDKVMDVAAEFSGEGEVDGPGTGVSDSIPARLSDGEFVFTKKATDQIGSDQLQTMMDDAERAYDGGYMKKAFGGLTLDPMDNEKSYGVEQMNETQNELRKQMLGANRMPSVLR
tara:strand:+ start:2944 stop:4620 length:1677 start_codon:yes stop_codon:yes gene_type:complete